MLLLKNILVLTIPSAFTILSTILFQRLIFLIFLSCAFFSEILGGLSQTSILSQDTQVILQTFDFICLSFNIIDEKMLFSLYPILGVLYKEKDNEDFNDLTFKEWLLKNKPAKVYVNSAESKDLIYKDNNNRSGVYLWYNTINEKYYIGSAVNLTRRFSQYYSEKYLTNTGLLIHKALLKNKHENFSLYILEYSNTDNLIELEQKYLSSLTPPYNILKIAGSTLGFKHTEETLEKFSLAKSGENHPMFGITGKDNPSYGKMHSEETRVKISEALSGENHPNFGKTFTHSVETKAKISKAMSAENHFNFGKSLSEETKAKMSIARTGKNNPVSKKVFVYPSSSPTILSHEFISYSEAAKHFNCSIVTISKYLKNGKVFQGEWVMYSSKK